MGKSILFFSFLTMGLIGVALGGERSGRAQNYFNDARMAPQQIYAIPSGGEVEGQGPEYRPVESAVEGQPPEYYPVFRRVYVQGMGAVYVPIQNIRMGQPPEY